MLISSPTSWCAWGPLSMLYTQPSSTSIRKEGKDRVSAFELVVIPKMAMARSIFIIEPDMAFSFCNIVGSVVIDKGSTPRKTVGAGRFNVFYNSGKDSVIVSGIDPKDDPAAVEGSLKHCCKCFRIIFTRSLLILISITLSWPLGYVITIRILCIQPQRGMRKLLFSSDEFLMKVWWLSTDKCFNVRFWPTPVCHDIVIRVDRMTASCAKAVCQNSVPEYSCQASPLHPIAAVELIEFWTAGSDPKQTFSPNASLTVMLLGSRHRSTKE